MDQSKTKTEVIKFENLMDSVWECAIKKLDPFKFNFVSQFQPDFDSWHCGDGYPNRVYVCVDEYDSESANQNLKLGNLIKEEIEKNLSLLTGINQHNIDVYFYRDTFNGNLHTEPCGIGESNLLCPNCGSAYLHHHLEIGVDKNDYINFFCEGCHGDLTLNIKHHKGTTIIGWIYRKTVANE